MPERARCGDFAIPSGVGRIMAFAECNGDLYASGCIFDDTPLSGGICRRIDGPQPHWEQVYRWKDYDTEWFDTLDTNHDGAITRLEAASAAWSAAESKLTARLGTDSAQAYGRDSTGPVPLSDSKAFTDLRFTRDWLPSFVASSQGVRSFEVRHLAVHRDRVTGVDRVIAALTSGSVFSGGYDAGAPGRIRWNPEPELSGRLARIMSCGSANGDAYLAVDITPDSPKNGGLFRRVDGPQPRWEWIGEWGNRHQHKGVAWIRGLTAIPDPANPGQEVLLCSREVDGVIEVIDPQCKHEVRIEFDLRKHFGGLVGAREGQRVTTIFAYNEMTPAVHPDTGERVHLVGGGLMPALRGDSAQAKGTWYLVRHADGRYGTGQVFDPDVIPTAHGGLRCVRTICASPFPEDCGRVFYFGGYDGGDLGTGMKHRDTAWIYRGALPTAGEEKP